MVAFNVPAIIEQYANGYFLMADDTGTGLNWYTSCERALVPLDHRFRYPRSLRRSLNQDRFQVSINQAFEQVVTGCADRETTWISPTLQQLYLALNRAGWAYSFETWQEEELAGGILGIAIGGAFIGESMFYRIPEGSKVAMVRLVERLRSRQFLLFDAQMTNPHLERFGAYVISNEAYGPLLSQAIQRRCHLI
ncbi:MAG: leucyl/phenylalanyl-tRNA--protein transferase [Elainellaceae cyanobacterium]